MLLEHITGREEAHQKLDDEFNSLVCTVLAPPPNLTVTEWADTYRFLSREASAEAGKYSSDRAPYQKAIMDALSDPKWRRVVLMLASQLGKTEVLNNAVGYYIHLDPGPILVVQPTDSMAETWSKDRLAPMFRDTPCLNHILPKSRNSGNTITHKKFPGGHITVVGSNSPTNLAGRPIRYLMMDEVDRFEASAGTEGDPVSQATRRTATFTFNKKIILVSTPGLKETSRIEPAYLESAQHKWYVPCPFCQHSQELVWKSVDSAGNTVYRITWEKTEDGKPLFNTTSFVCEGCGALIDETFKPWMLENGEVVCLNPDYEGDSIGFHINALYSPFESWTNIAREFHEAQASKNKERMKVWVNTILAETWAEVGERVDAHKLSGRIELYDGEVPVGVRLLTAGIDVQGDRIEILVVGWGAGTECWLIHHEVLAGDTSKSDVWGTLGPLLNRTYQTPNGAKLRVMVAAIDHGHQPDRVEHFTRSYRGCRLLVVKGEDGWDRPIIERPSKAKLGVFKPWLVGTFRAKDELLARWGIGTPEDGGPASGPRAIHLPAWVTEAFLEQLTVEEKRVEYKKNGQPAITWYKPKHKPNEATDMWVYAYGALKSLGSGVEQMLDRMKPQEAPSEVPAEVAQPTITTNDPLPEATKTVVTNRFNRFNNGGGQFGGGWNV